MSTLKERDQLYVANTYSRFPVDLVRGHGSLLYDADGKRYIDMGSGIGVTAFGICDEIWTAAVTEQLGKLQHVSNLYYTEPCVSLAEKLCALTGMKKVFFGNSGAEANECAIKVARKYAQDKYGMERYKIITLRNSFHGRTLTTLAATGQDVFHTRFLPLTEGFVHAVANDIESVKALLQAGDVAGILIECIQGEGGVIPLEKEFVTEIARLAAERDVLLMVDEVQTGNGRTGMPYAYMNYGITPDVISTAKGLGGGLPIGACLIGEKAEYTLSYGDHGSTFGGNPRAAAGAISIVDRLTPETMQSVREKSQYIFDTLSGSKGVKSITGMGLMIGILTERPAKEVVAECLSRGVLCLTAKEKVRLLPALNIPSEVLSEAVNVIKSVCEGE